MKPSECVKVMVCLSVLVMFAYFLTPAAYSAVSDEEFLAICGEGMPLQVEAAIKNGADVNAKDDEGWTALINAARNNSNPEIIALLLKNGADVNAKDNYGWTALMFAARRDSNPEIIMLLLKNGADARLKDNKGKRAADYASGALKKSPVFKELVKAGR